MTTVITIAHSENIWGVSCET